MKKSIYMVTCLEIGNQFWDTKRGKDGIFHCWRKRTSKSQRESWDVIGSVTWGWYSKLTDAKIAVEKNMTDLNDHCYNYAIVSKVSEGLLSCDMEECWYMWTGKDWENGCYRPIKKPERFKNVVNFWH